VVYPVLTGATLDVAHVRIGVKQRSSLKVCSSVVELRKKVVEDDTETLKKPQWGIPHPPGNSSTAVHDDDHDDRGLARLEQFVADGI